MEQNLLLGEFQKYALDAEGDAELISRAYKLALRAHEGQRRKSGEPYVTHSIAVALQLIKWRMDAATIAGGLLHDVAEDTRYTIEQIRKEFGGEVALLVEGVTKLGALKYTETSGKAENLRRLMLAVSRDMRVIFIKLADRLHNMKTLSHLPEVSQKRISLETSEIYSPLAYQLGMQGVSGELEDLAFPYLHKEKYDWLVKHVSKTYGEREKYLEKVREVLAAALAKQNLRPVSVESRAKRYSSLYKKLIRYDMDIAQIYDLVAVRVIVNNIEECYAVLGVIHQLWPPMPGRIKDYIALPKPNGYRSLHTTVFCINKKPTEFQIRTVAMHEESENGIAAHWAYQLGKRGKAYKKRRVVSAGEKETAWVARLRSWDKEYASSEEFVQALKIDFLGDRIYVLTPKGTVLDLPAGATPVDFAYSIHTDVGHSCVGARVNGKIVPLTHQLQSGDLVEILTQKNKKPSDSWLLFVKTDRAKKKIRALFKKSRESSSLRAAPKSAELKITVRGRIGLLEDISSVISRSHINILSVSMPQSTPFHTTRIVIATADRYKIEKLLMKLKEIRGVKEIGFRLL